MLTASPRTTLFWKSRHTTSSKVSLSRPRTLRASSAGASSGSLLWVSIAEGVGLTSVCLCVCACVAGARDRYTGGLTLLIVYGYRVVSNTDKLLEMADESLRLLSNHIAAAGKVWIVDLFPPRAWASLS